jgi:replicative DNA helicase
MQIPVPSNLEAEVQILGALMARDRIYYDLAADVSADDFFDDGHAEIFRTIAALVDTGKRVTASLVLDYLGSAHVKTHVDASYIDQIMDAVADTRDAIHYARQVRDLARRRRWIQAAVDGINTIGRLDPLQPAQNVIDAADTAILNSSRVDTSQVRQLYEWAQILNARVADSIDKPSVASQGLKWGLTACDNVVGPVVAGKLIILGGRPGSGKSALAGQAAEAFGRQAPGYVQSLEMPGEEWGARALSAATDMAAWRIDQARVNEEEFGRLDDAARALRKLPVWIDQAESLDFDKIRARAIRYKHKYNIQWMMLDHLHIVEAPYKKADDFATINYTCKGLKNLAKQLNIGIVCLAQMNKEVRNRDDGRPRAGDLLYYSAIEPHADSIMFTHRAEIALAERKPDMSDPDSKAAKDWKTKMEMVEGKAEIINAKRRGGKAYQTQECEFVGPLMRFRDLSTKELPLADQEMRAW